MTSRRKTKPSPEPKPEPEGRPNGSAPDPEVAQAAADAFPSGSAEEPKGESPRRGRAKGSTPWNKGLKGYKRSEGRRSEPVGPTDEETAACTYLVTILWSVLEPRVGLLPLSADEGANLGGAVAAVVKKYVPGYGAYEPEINLVLIVGLLVATKYVGKSKPDDGVPSPVKESRAVDGPPAVDPRVAERFGT